MKATSSAVVGLMVSLCFLVGTVHGTTILNEPFDYISGDLDDVSGSTWTPVSSSGSNPIQVISGRVAGLDADVRALEDVATAFGASATTLFYGLDVSFTGPSVPIGSVYFAAFRTGVTEVGRLFIAAPTGGAANSFRLGNAQNTAGDGGAAINYFENLSFGTIYRVVVSYDPVIGVTRLTVIGPNGSLGTLGVLADRVPFLDSFLLRQGGNASNSYSGLNVDNLIIATTFEEAVGAVPEPGTWAMIALGAAILVATQRRRRRPRAL